MSNYLEIVLLLKEILDPVIPFTEKSDLVNRL
jgi:hypothetical protein